MKPGERVIITRYSTPLPGIINHISYYEHRTEYYVRSEHGSDITGPYTAEEMDLANPQAEEIRFVPAFICTECGSELSMLKVTNNSGMCYHCGVYPKELGEEIFKQISKKVTVTEFEKRMKLKCLTSNTTY